MSGWIVAESEPQPDLPADHLAVAELQELQRLLTTRAALEQQAQVVHQRLELLLLAVRDRRGLTGTVRVHPDSGIIMKGDPAPSEEDTSG